ncbi:MAG: tetratricopeptide repeat protein [Nitrospirales bacterium]
MPLFASTILLGFMVSSAAMGSHFDSSTPHAGPPQIPPPPQAQEQVPTRRTTPVSLPQVQSNHRTHTPTQPKPNSTVDEQKRLPAKPHPHVGWTLLLNGQTEAALSAYRQALRHNPQSAHAYLGLGISLQKLGEVELAKKAFAKAVDLDPGLPAPLVHLGYLYAEGHYGTPDLSTARRLFKEAAQLGDPFAAIALLDLKSSPTL